ncbi:3-mercaptopyruvate sulfurtransferase [Hoeflea prorocentri]|uniref:3-mercaptopyruvate sulfurtransferase n=2 Tax=Hoeflea prorocentri TaxID=1922333 RepID=A0A9X3ZH97_9HYPH|nr:3-mercaptopyruvate sulfurtransferase [Hoeflea prorocentri]MCY6380550.1 3-mercaptopyruvate sulfurtransferase [Hoeflea prorocentri]MDA5398350.1 3-mercaptopyruvate sulfurtransferase [Hoeflea prorocentri]
MAEKSAFVVSADWLQERIGNTGLKIVDASWYLPAQGRNARSEYESGHILGAVFFDQDVVVDPDMDLPHALPGPEHFAGQVSGLGISTDDTIVVYDGPGMFTAPRVWWMFRAMGAPNVFVLDGGFDRWKADGRPVTTEIPEYARGTFKAVFRDGWAADLERVLEVAGNGSSQIADARSPGRFTGDEPEPREGMRCGHMPGARNVPVFSLSQDGELKSLEDLRATLEEAGIDPNGPVITTCGSGVTAAVITLALHSLGNEDTQLYDGSWSEWGARKDTPVVTGEE